MTCHICLCCRLHALMQLSGHCRQGYSIQCSPRAQISSGQNCWSRNRSPLRTEVRSHQPEHSGYSGLHSRASAKKRYQSSGYRQVFFRRKYHHSAQEHQRFQLHSRSHLKVLSSHRSWKGRRTRPAHRCRCQRRSRWYSNRMRVWMHCGAVCTA